MQEQFNSIPYKTSQTSLVDSSFNSRHNISLAHSARQPVFSVEYFVDGTVEVFLHASLSSSNRYAHLTQLLHDLRDDPAWRVVRQTPFPQHFHIGTVGQKLLPMSQIPTEEKDCLYADYIGNLTVAIPELLYPHTTIRFRLVPANVENMQFANSRVRFYDFCTLEQARFESHRIRLTHKPETVCQISINHLQCAQTTAKQLPDCIDATYNAWKQAADPSMIQCEPVITICVQNRGDCSVIIPSSIALKSVEEKKETNSTEKTEMIRQINAGKLNDFNDFLLSRPTSRDESSLSSTRSADERSMALHAKKRLEAAIKAGEGEQPTSSCPSPSFAVIMTIKYEAPQGCERQTEVQAIYRDRGSQMLNPQPRFSCARSMYDENAHNDYCGFLKQKSGSLFNFAMNGANDSLQTATPLPSVSSDRSLGQVVNDIAEVSSLRALVEEQGKQIARLQQQRLQTLNEVFPPLQAELPTNLHITNQHLDRKRIHKPLFSFSANGVEQ